MIPTHPFGNTGHHSTRILFGAAALGAMRQEKADKVFELLLEHGINHIDTAASYGDAELRIGPWMKRHRRDFFLASKSGDRTYADAKESIQRSLERLCTDHLDLIQMHNLVDEREWQIAMGAGGALEALVEAREQGLVRFLGVTGHGVSVAARHRQSLERFPFDSVLLPYNYTMMQIPAYAADFEAVVAMCEQRNVAVQTIKSVARRRWGDEPGPRFSWYEPLRDREALRRAVHFVLARPGFFLSSSSDATLLPLILELAAVPIQAPAAPELERDVAAFAMRPLFEPGVDAI